MGQAYVIPYNSLRLCAHIIKNLWVHGSPGRGFYTKLLRMISGGTIVCETPTFPSPRKESHMPLLVLIFLNTYGAGARQ